MLADGSIHLTGILLLAPHLTQENHDELLVHARYRTKRELEKLVADVAPCADVPSLIQPLGRAPAAPGRPPSTWAALVRGWAGPVRQLVPGDGRAQAPMGELARRAAYGGSDEAAASHDSGQRRRAPRRRGTHLRLTAVSRRAPRRSGKPLAHV